METDPKREVVEGVEPSLAESESAVIAVRPYNRGTMVPDQSQAAHEAGREMSPTLGHHLLGAITKHAVSSPSQLTENGVLLRNKAAPSSLRHRTQESAVVVTNSTASGGLPQEAGGGSLDGKLGNRGLQVQDGFTLPI